MSNTTERGSLVLGIDPRAVDTIQAMKYQDAAVTAAWNAIKPEWASRTSTSLARSLADLLNDGMGSATAVHRDGPLSLYVVTSSIHYGVIGHPITRADEPIETDIRMTSVTATRLGRFCLVDVSDGGTDRYCSTPIYQGQSTCGHAHRPIFAMPLPIEWSLHS